MPKSGLLVHYPWAEGTTRRGSTLPREGNETGEGLGVKRDLMAEKLVQINETMRALTFLMDVRG